MTKEPNFNPEDFFIAPASLSDARAGGLLPTRGSEDASHLLHPFSGMEPDGGDADEERDYLPSAKVDWVVHVDLQPGEVLRKPELDAAFGVPWLNANDRPTVYGLSPENGRWTFVHAAGVPETYSRLQIAWKMRPFGKDGPIPEDHFERYRFAVQRVAEGIQAAAVRTELSPAEAAAQSARLIALAASCDRSVAVVLQAPDGRRFDGRVIWDVMLCLGLRWGDMDVFHWDNPGVPGDDHLFSVWTSTPPGYFFPEEIAAGRVWTDDLVFGFSIPRVHQPERIFDSLIRAAQYTRTRLGGELTTAERGRFTEAAVRGEIRRVVRELEKTGFEPGAYDTLYLI